MKRERRLSKGLKLKAVREGKKAIRMLEDNTAKILDKIDKLRLKEAAVIAFSEEIKMQFPALKKQTKSCQLSEKSSDRTALMLI